MSLKQKDDSLIESRLSSETKINILQKRLMKSNIDRDKNAELCSGLTEEVNKFREDNISLREENRRLNSLINTIQNRSECNDVNCLSKEQLKMSQQNYAILENSHKELELQICFLSTEKEKRDIRVSEMFNDHKKTEEKLRVAEKRCLDYENTLSKLELELNTYKNSKKTCDVLNSEIAAVRTERSKLRNELEFLLDERDTREVTLEELYKQLTETRKSLAVLEENHEELTQQYQGLFREYIMYN